MFSVCILSRRGTEISFDSVTLKSNDFSKQWLTCNKLSEKGVEKEQTYYKVLYQNKGVLKKDKKGGVEVECVSD